MLCKQVFSSPEMLSRRDEGRGDKVEKYLGGKTMKTCKVVGFGQENVGWRRSLR